MGALARTDAIAFAEDPLDDYPVPTDRLLAERDLRYGQMAVVIHQGQDWPSGRFCLNCHARWPCRLARWGHAVLTVAGWRSADIAHLIARAKAGEVPWS